MCAKAPRIGACANTYILKLVSFGYKMKLCVCIVTRDIGIHACIDAYIRYLTLPYPTLITFTLHYHWEFQDPKMEVLYYIRPYFGGISPYIW